MLTQENPDKAHTDETNSTFVLPDEIEKASADSLWQLLLGILDKATLTLGDNRRVDFSKNDRHYDFEPRRARDERYDLGRHRIRPSKTGKAQEHNEIGTPRSIARRSRRPAANSRRSL
ncbi:MAG: hypothetical protein IPJ30_23825 [Acidobacteria bacterium]|nr:hypothetical protein [Acidobacteriota bacterium]